MQTVGYLKLQIPCIKDKRNNNNDNDDDEENNKQQKYYKQKQIANANYIKNFETVENIISACPILAKEKYIKRTDRVCVQLHFNI